jgi:RimJ/RimL family protein N-acetyltransferase
MPPATLLPCALTDKAGHPFVVRQFDPSDRPELERMYVDFEPKRRAQGLPPEGADSLGRWLDRVLGRGAHLVIEVDGRLLGHAMLIPRAGGDAELANFLHQSIRNRGIGTALNLIVVDEARARGYRRVWLSVEPSNRAALRSYRRAGFHLLSTSHLAQEVEMEVIL